MSPGGRRAFVAVAAALALCGAGCGSDADTGSTASVATPTTAASTTVMEIGATSTTSPTSPAESSTTFAATEPTGSETSVAESGPIDSSVQAVVDRATTDLVARLGIDPAEVTVLSAKAVTWPDKSLGCPKPGLQYLQVLVDGALVELQAGGQTYSYHSGDDGKPALCEQAFSATPIPPATS